ncbi:myocardin-like isoform X4 [Xyrauchen texanus]|uniref:myocardin-like isoform X4 n=1 Tax=Xyrauchen texanus TaxID=154827 RepID=UPI0022424D31|nr:myocardin-like isoform X4 [Xyrauchen texanus]
MTLLGSEHSILIRSKFKSVLQLRLQQRRTREQLADQGIMPPLKSPAAFHEQRKSLELSKTGAYLKHKIRSRPEKSELINLQILQDTASEGPAQDSQTKLKRARLADNLNEKIALRPGPLELVEKNIIPADSTVKEVAMKVNHGKYAKKEDSYAFEEDSNSDSLSPEQPHSEESQGSAEPLPENKPSSSPSPTLTNISQGSQVKEATNQNQEDNAHMTNTQANPPIPVSAIVKSKMSDKNRHKKPKDIKPKVKKLKYHQYIPPDQKTEKSPPPPMNSAYARLLQQQQLFLQLQILSQQKHQHHSHPHQHQCPQSQSFSYHTLNQHTPNKQSSEQQLLCSSNGPTSGINSSSSSPVKTTYCNPTSITPVRPGPLPANLDDLKVSELRQQLRIRGLPVSGTKTALIERLQPFKDSSSSSGDISTVTFPVTPSGSLSSYQSPCSSSAMSHGGGYYPFCSSSSTPPISPASSDLSVSNSVPDSFSDVTMSSPQFGLQPSPAQLSTDEGQSISSALGAGCLCGETQAGLEPLGLDAEKEQMLVEKQKVIEELTWKLHQEQRQVEELRMQLHKRKHTHCLQECPTPPLAPPSQHLMHLQPPSQMQQFYGVSVKQEHVASSCPLSSKQLNGGPINSCMEGMGHCDLHNGPHCLEVPSSGSPAGLSAFLSPQCSPQDSPVTKTSSSPQPNSLPSSPSHPYRLTPPLGRDGCSHPLAQNRPRPCNMQLQQKNIGQTVSCSYSSDQRSMQPVCPSPAESNLNPRGSSKAKRANMQQKQMTRSQQMDELLDVLIESGEMPANAKEERSPVTKVVPHLTVSPNGVAISKFHRHYSHISPTLLPFEHAAGPGNGHLEVLLSPIARQGDSALLKMGAEEGHLEKDGEGFISPQHDDKLLSNRDMMNTPMLPMASKVSPVSVDSQGLGMTFTESPWESMEWLELTPPSSATAFNNNMPPAGPSIFNTEFLDVTDINLNSTMDLHLEHW